MSGATLITVVGNLVAEPELRFTASGAGVANFTVASTERIFDKASGEWKDSPDTLFMRCSIWRQPAENLVESNLDKGTRVVVTGKLKQRSYETKEGEKRTVVELDAEEVAVSTKFASVSATRAARSSTGGSARGASAPADDPWGSAPPAGGYDSSEPPFHHVPDYYNGL